MWQKYLLMINKASIYDKNTYWWLTKHQYIDVYRILECESTNSKLASNIHRKSKEKPWLCCENRLPNMKYGKCISLHFWLTYTINKHLSNQINSWHTILGYSIANQNLCGPVTKLVNIESDITNLYHILIIIPYTINISASLGHRDKRGGGSQCCVTNILTTDFSYIMK